MYKYNYVIVNNFQCKCNSILILFLNVCILNYLFHANMVTSIKNLNCFLNRY